LTGGAFPIGVRYKKDNSLPVKANGFYKTSICYVVLQTAPLNV